MVSNVVIETQISRGDVLHYSLRKINKYKFTNEDKKILSLVGVKKYAAPAIEFLNEEEGGLERLSKYYGLEDVLYKCITLANYKDGIIVFNELSGEIELIESESLDSIFVNSTLKKLINCLKVYNNLINEVINRDKELNLYIDNFTRTDLIKLRKELLNVDDMSLNNNSFWYLIFTTILEEISFNLI